MPYKSLFLGENAFFTINRLYPMFATANSSCIWIQNWPTKNISLHVRPKYVLIGYTFGIIIYCSLRFCLLSVGFSIFIFVSSGSEYSIRIHVSFTRLHSARIQQFRTIFSCNFKSARNADYMLLMVVVFHICILVTTLVRIICIFLSFVVCA